MDCYDSKTRSEVMRKVHSKNTNPEVFVRKALHKAGFRFRLHQADLPGTPDIVLRRYKTVIFVHGCFWHRHPNCKRATMPAQNVDFWQKKLLSNVERDERNVEKLRALSWQVIVIWECQIKKQGFIDEISRAIKKTS